MIDKVFKRIGIEHFNVNTLIEKIKDDDAVWSLYANGYTIGLNQVEQDGSRKKCMKYKPHNLSELSAFVAAIRPGFKSMYSKFENREDFSWGISALDNLLRTDEFPYSWILYQEHLMSVLNYGGFPMDECYGIIKAIAKKHPEKVRPLKQKFIDGFRERLIEDEGLSQKAAQKNAEDVWVIINDNCGYGFNSAHAYCMALDSLYQAWQKAHYPYEFYEVLLQHYSDKGNKSKVATLKAEMKQAFGISEGKYRFRNDNRQFTADPEHKMIQPSLASIKSISQTTADILYGLKDNEYEDFVDLLIGLQDVSINSKQLDILIKLDYFSEFGTYAELLKQVELFDKIYGKKQFKKDQLEKLGIPEYIMARHAKTQTEKMFKDFDSVALLRDVIANTEVPKVSVRQRVANEFEYLGYSTITDERFDEEHWYVVDVLGAYKNMLSLYNLKSGEYKIIKLKKDKFREPPVKGNIIKVTEYTERNKMKLDGVDEKGRKIFVETDEREIVVSKYNIVC